MSAVKNKTKKPITTPEALNLDFRLRDIRSLEFQLTDEGRKLPAGFGIEAYEYRFDIASAILNKERLMNVLLTTTILLKRGETVRTELGILKTLASFEIMNLEEIVKYDHDPRVREHLCMLTYGITLSSARGMLAVHLIGTNLTHAMIPVVDPKKLVANLHNTPGVHRSK